MAQFGKIATVKNPSIVVNFIQLNFRNLNRYMDFWVV
jgi:hypothetical protein